MMRLGVFGAVYHLENAEMTPELQDNLINFSFDNLQDVFNFFHIQILMRTTTYIIFLAAFQNV